MATCVSQLSRIDLNHQCTEHQKDEGQQIDLLNEILKELNEIKFSKRIDELENKLMKDFDEKSYSDLMELKSQRNKE